MKQPHISGSTRTCSSAQRKVRRTSYTLRSLQFPNILFVIALVVAPACSDSSAAREAKTTTSNSNASASGRDSVGFTDNIENFAARAQAQTRRALDSLRNEIAGFERRRGSLPKSMEELLANSGGAQGLPQPVDGWGQRIEFLPNGSKITLTSRGPDGRLHTNDDIVARWPE